MDATALEAQFQGEILSAALVAEPETPRTDGLDLPRMAARALNYLRGNPDPARGYECKFDLGPLGIPAHEPRTVPPNEYGHDPVSIGDTDCRMMLQYARMRAMAGEAMACEVEQGVRGRVLGYLCEDGMAWTNPASWSGTPIAGYWINKWASAKIMMLLANDFAATGDEADRARARKLFEGLKSLAVWDGPRAYYPGGGVPVKDGQYLTEGWAEHHSKNYPSIVEPCLEYAELCGDEEAVDFAVAMAEGFLASSQPGQDELRIDPETGAFGGHVHLHTHALIGVARLGILTGDERYLDWAEQAYDFIRHHGTDYGWYPEFIPQHTHGAETCVVGDMVALGVWLGQRHPHCFDHVARTVRNYLRLNQFFLTDDFVALFGRLHADKPREVVAAALDELRKLEGGFVSAPAPDDWVRYPDTLGATGRSANGIDMMGCCPPEGMRALWEAWRWTVQELPGGVRVNLPFHRDHPAARVTAGAPEQGWVRVEPRREGDVQVRPPAWATRGEVTVQRSEQPAPVQWSGPDDAYVTCTNVKVGETLQVHWPVPVFVQRQTLTSVPGRELDLTIQWEGDEVEALDPCGQHLPIFERC